MKSKTDRGIFTIPSTVWIISLVTLLVNLSSIMIFSLSPLYLTQVFGLAPLYLGILEGMIELASWMIRGFSGVVSDYLKKRKLILLIAYGLATLARPVFALASGAVWVYLGKVADRTANGLQASPREALISDVAPKHLKGTCYGLRHSLGVLGSLLGALLLIVLMRNTDNDYRLIFWLAGIPTFLGFAVVLFCIKDHPFSEPGTKKEGKSKVSLREQLQKISRFDFSFWSIILIAGVFMLSNYSGAYRILYAEKAGFAVSDVSSVMVVQNLGVMIAAFPIGRLSDRIDRRILLALGVMVAVISNGLLCLASGIFDVLIGSSLWGVQMGITQSMFLSMIADVTPKGLRGSAFGIYYLAVALACCGANVVTGWLFELKGSSFAFAVSGCIGAVALFLIPFIRKPADATKSVLTEKL